MNTTQYFEEKLGQKVVAEVSDPTGKYHMWDDGGTEAEVGDFLYGMVRVLKPNRILETGLYSGVSCSYMAQGLKDNGVGEINSIEFDWSHIQRASERLAKLELSSLVTIAHQSSLTFEPVIPYDLVLLDTEPEIRFQEMVKFFPHVKPGGYIFIHDLHRHMSQEPNEKFFGWPFGQIPDAFKTLVKENKLRPFHFPTPRGLSGFYKVDLRDYVWT